LARGHALKERYRRLKFNRDGEPQLYSNCLTPVTTFLKCLFKKEWILKAMEQSSPSVWKKLETSYINFSHFAEDIQHPDAYKCLSEDGLLSLFLRGCAIKCAYGQEGIDMVIPMAVLPDSNLNKKVSKSDISAIIIQVKNKREDARRFTTEFIDDKKFNIQHISGLSASKKKPYLGLWLSFGAMKDDLSIEGYDHPFTGDSKPSNFVG
jgi:hypothetical protein